MKERVFLPGARRRICMARNLQIGTKIGPSFFAIACDAVCSWGEGT